MNAHEQGPACPACGGGSSRAVRTQGVHVDAETIYYLTYVWACAVCGKQWMDPSLDRINAWAAHAACLSAGGDEGAIFPGSMGRLAP